MGYKGTIRAIQAEINRSRREAQKRHREAQRQLAAQQRALEVERVALEVEVHEARIAAIQTVHHEVSQDIDWSELAQLPEPPAPEPVSRNEDAARRDLDAFRPSSILKKRAERKRQALEEAVKQAAQADQAEYAEAQREHQASVAEWKETTEIARRVLSGDTVAYSDALAMLQPFTDIEELGSSVRCEFLSPRLATATLNVAGESTIPSESKKQLATGKLSVKQMTKTAFYEIYQDFVCSSVLRIASELTHLLPTTAVVITAVDRMLDPATGHMKDQPILSVAIPEETLQQINLRRVDPSDSLGNFVHSMSFKKTKGFEPVEAIDPETLELT